MTQATKILIRLTFLCTPWLLIRGVQFLLELAELNYEACEVSRGYTGGVVTN